MCVCEILLCTIIYQRCVPITPIPETWLQVRGGQMPALLRYASSPLSSAEKLRVLQALQRSQPQKLERFVALNGPKVLEQWISLEVQIAWLEKMQSWKKHQHGFRKRWFFETMSVQTSNGRA